MFSFKRFRRKSEVTVDKIKHIFRQMSLFINVFRFWITNSFWDLVRKKTTLKNKAYWDICDTSPEVECFFQISFVILLTKILFTWIITKFLKIQYLEYFCDNQKLGGIKRSSLNTFTNIGQHYPNVWLFKSFCLLYFGLK